MKKQAGPRDTAPPTAESEMERLLELVTATSQPNLNALRALANTIEPMCFSIKQMGYMLARQMADAIPQSATTSAAKYGLRGGLSTQTAIESPWVAHWCRELKIPVIYHRKVWELCFVLQALHEADLIAPGVQGVGFGCGGEPLASYLAANGAGITVTDLPPEQAIGTGWIETNQHTGSLQAAFMPQLITREEFSERISLRYVNMNAIPEDLRDYDFCWSVCALEHLGSIANGLNFIENSLSTLRPGGLAVHTTEFNIKADGPTIDNWSTVAFQRKHIEQIADRLSAEGHSVTPIDYDLGDKPLDRFVDLPPYDHDLSPELAPWFGQSQHLKLALDGLVVTCLGLIVRKRY